jgi:hypothetical protein
MTLVVRIVADSIASHLKPANRLTTALINFDDPHSGIIAVQGDISQTRGAGAIAMVESWRGRTVVVTADARTWEQFLERHWRRRGWCDVQPVFQALSERYAASKPGQLRGSQWHLPFVSLRPGSPDYGTWMEYQDMLFWRQVSAVRCDRGNGQGSDGHYNAIRDWRLFQAQVWTEQSDVLWHQARPLTTRELAHTSQPATEEGYGWRFQAEDTPALPEFSGV